MTEPQIQYAKTSDGVNIAYWTLGEGKPLVYMPFLMLSHLQLEWRSPENRAWYEALADRRQLIRYDPRGVGLSDREVADYSLDAHMLDLEAVVKRLGIERFDLFAPARIAPVGIAYAARHPDRVSHLILWNAGARIVPASVPKKVQVAGTLASQDWEMFLETFARVMVGWSANDQAGQAAGMMRESITQEAYLAREAALADGDVTDQLPEVQAPTLVLHRRKYTLPAVDAARELASQIPDARLALIEGDLAVPTSEETDTILAAIGEFLGDGREVATQAGAPEAGAFRTILFTDVEGSTALTDRLGDAIARELLREHERITREALSAHGGSEVKTMGDGFMASFSSATKALECAIALQKSFAHHNESAEEAIKVRIGLNAGEPIAEDDPGGRGDLFGTAVNMAARIAAKADAGEILASNVVRELVAGKDFLFSDLGETELRGFEDPVKLWELRWQDAG